jgi:transcriptional regulator with XRE-family HTH domain
MARPLLSQEELDYASELRSWRERRGLTKKALADTISYDPSRVSHIEAGRQPPTEEFTRQAEEALQTGGALWECWEALAAGRFVMTTRRPERNLRTTDSIGWLARSSRRPFQAMYSAVSAMTSRLEAEPPSVRHAAAHARRLVTRSQVAGAVRRYYGNPEGARRFYTARVNGEPLRLSILTDPAWMNCTAQLGTDAEQVSYEAGATTPIELDDVTVGAAIRRLAAVELTDTVIVNNPLYRLLNIAVDHHSITASLGLSEFAAYALTSDLLEEELLAAIGSAGDQAALDPTGAMPLRTALLPSTAAATTLDARVCVGGAVALTAVARRPADSPPDYLLLVQERSSAVLNVTGRLAVIPKAFHQPLDEPAREAPVSVTLERELEEELLGREDLERLAVDTGSRRVAPLHPRGVSEPLAWLIAHRDTGSYQRECTGFGFNMVTGNYEFACLIVIDDERWWDNFGHLVQMNWEAARVHCLSSLDTDGLAALASDPRWSNEGLFAFLQGLRRLAQLDTAGRVAAPTITPEV